MKTQNNNQETGKSQVSKLTLSAGIVFLSAVMISASVNAQDLWDQLSNTVSYGKMTLTMDEQLVETKNADAAIATIQSELDDQLNFSNEFSIATEAEEPINVESWMTDESFFNEAEQFTAEGSELEIAKYAERIINEESEEALDIESWMTDEKFFQEAEQYTANGADKEIAKYAEKIISSVEAEEELAIESWMTEANFFLEADQLTAKDADKEIAKYAEKIIRNVENEDRMAIENWMLDSENFSNQSQYEHLAVN